ncbi:hypothetical protein C9374_013882 [Naegleria lovaniensis]|uniref:Uncharacterized protein n=1 Tax=Naegleria lovaniensis TaxID=51637 RepID=A0AA88KUP4_NAELO|nr:uncharacterized protein C9374_013882 [Naegleria lovaniensis]KAG2389322.1 hypothetical protein C9374_013882 [Naegleria lovaniensis]
MQPNTHDGGGGEGPPTQAKELSIVDRSFLEVLKREFNITKGLEDFSTQQLASLVRVLRLNKFDSSSSSESPSTRFQPSQGSASPNKNNHLHSNNTPPTTLFNNNLSSSTNNNGGFQTPQKNATRRRNPSSSSSSISSSGSSLSTGFDNKSNKTIPLSSPSYKRSHSDLVKPESIEVLDADDDVEFVGASSSSIDGHSSTPPKKPNTNQHSPYNQQGSGQLAQNNMSPPSGTPPRPSSQQDILSSLATNPPIAMTLAAQQHGIDPVSFMAAMQQAQQRAPQNLSSQQSPVSFSPTTASVPFASLLLTSPTGPMSLHNAEIARKQRKLEKKAAKESPNTSSTASTPSSSNAEHSNNHNGTAASTPSSSTMSTPTKTEFTFVDHSTPSSSTSSTKTPRKKSKKKEKEAKIESSTLSATTPPRNVSSPLTATTTSSPFGSPIGSPLGSPFTPLSQSSPFPSASSSQASSQPIMNEALLLSLESAGEKRSARFVPQCSSKILDRINRALKQRLFLIDRKDRNGNRSEKFIVLGSTGNVYEVSICEKPTCNCPDFKRGNLCKHILFVYLRVLRVSATSYIIYQKALLSAELESVFLSAPPVLSHTLKADERVIDRYKQLSQGTVSEQEIVIGSQRKTLIGASCPICYEEFKSGKEKTDCCLVCGHNVHDECLNAWKKFDSNYKCPVCKTAKLGKDQQNVLATSEGYANLSQYQPNINRYR